MHMTDWDFTLTFYIDLAHKIFRKEIWFHSLYILWKNVVIKTRFIFYNWWVAVRINWLLVYYCSAPNFPIVLFPLPTSLPHPPGFRHRWWGCRRWFPPLSWLEAGPHPQWCPSWQDLSRPCAAPSRSDRHSWSGCTLGRGGWRKAVKMFQVCFHQFKMSIRQRNCTKYVFVIMWF